MATAPRVMRLASLWSFEGLVISNREQVEVVMAARASRLTRIEQSLQALELRSRGYTLAEMAATMNISVNTAKRRVAYALQQLGASTADEIRREIEHRLDGMQRRVHGLLDRADLTRGEELRLMRLSLEIERDRSRLLGVAVPPSVVLELEGDSGVRATFGGAG